MIMCDTCGRLDTKPHIPECPPVCEDCGRHENEPHTAECESALAQDYEDGTIKPDDEYYSDAQEAFNRQEERESA